MILDPFKRILHDILCHAILPVEELSFRVDLHQSGYVDLRLVLKRTDRELPILLAGKVDHQLIDEVTFPGRRVARDHGQLPRSHRVNGVNRCIPGAESLPRPLLKQVV